VCILQDGSSWTVDQLAIAVPRSRFSSIKPVATLAGKPYPIFAGTVHKLRWNIFKARTAGGREQLHACRTPQSAAVLQRGLDASLQCGVRI
jgi:hypothetical protein